MKRILLFTSIMIYNVFLLTSCVSLNKGDTLVYNGNRYILGPDNCYQDYFIGSKYYIGNSLFLSGFHDTYILDSDTDQNILFTDPTYGWFWINEGYNFPIHSTVVKSIKLKKLVVIMEILLK